MIDTEFGSDLLSYESDDLSEDNKQRRQGAGVGKAAPMAIGREWHSLDVSLLLFIWTIGTYMFHISISLSFGGLSCSPKRNWLVTRPSL
jgi:hypothetical protein